MTSSSSQWGGPRYKPMVFTEQGVAMLSSVLRSRRAVQVNIEIMRAFVRLRQEDRGLFSHRKTQTETGVILELKAVEQLQKIHEAQLLNYLKATGIEVGLLVNFTHPKAEIKRFVLNLPEGHDA